jgi:hypothetical protein
VIAKSARNCKEPYFCGYDIDVGLTAVLSEDVSTVSQPAGEVFSITIYYRYFVNSARKYTKYFYVIMQQTTGMAGATPRIAACSQAKKKGA